MSDSQRLKLKIQEVIHELMDRVMCKVLEKEPFVKDVHRAQKPLYAALVPDEIFKGSHFERRFVTPFGKVWERLAAVAAEESLGHGVIGTTITGMINEARLNRITEILNRLEHPDRERKGRVRPDWDEEMSYITKGKSKKKIPVSVTCDLYARNNATGRQYVFEIKAPLPNSDQTKVSKEKLLKLYCMEPMKIDEAYYALPYNPYGKREDYDWSFPSRWFNMKEDGVVLIGDEFWDKIGGQGTFQAFIGAINEIGPAYRNRIYREYLGIEPPPHDQWKL